MKRLIILLLLVVSLLSGCNKEKELSVDDEMESEFLTEDEDVISESDDYTYEGVVLSRPKNAIEKDGEYVPDFLDNPQQQLYVDAKEAFSQFNMMCDGFGSTESGTPIRIGLDTYYPADGKYTDWKSFEGAMLALFTSDYFTELNTESLPDGTTYQHFINQNGKLYYTHGARGGDITYIGLDSFQLVSKSDNEIRFKVVGVYYADFDYNADNLTTEEHSLSLNYTSTGWRFSLFALPY